MKKYIGCAIAILMWAGMNGVSAQSSALDKELEKSFEEILAAIPEDLSKTSEIKKVNVPPALEKIILKSLIEIDKQNASNKGEIGKKYKEYIPKTVCKSQPLDKDLMALLASMPEPITSLPQAKAAMKRSNPEDVFTKYIDRVKKYQEQLQSQAQQEIRQYLDSKEDMEKQAKQNIQKGQQNLETNPMVIEAGGMENLKKMSQAERAELGKKVAAKMKQNPDAYKQLDADPRKAFANKIATDHVYAEHYKNMNAQQKQEEYKTFMKENGFIDNEEARSAAVQTKENISGTTTEITKRTSAIYQHRQEMAAIAAAAQKRVDEYYESVYKKLDEMSANKGKSIEWTADSEAGRYKKTESVNIAYSLTRYPVDTRHAVSDRDAWKIKVDALKVSIAEYEQLLCQYWGKDKATNKIMAQRNQTPASIAAGICGDIIQLAKEARFKTNESASRQRAYDERISRVFE